MRAARSAALWMASMSRRVRSSSSRPAQPLGARQDRRQRIVQFVRHAGHGLSQRRHFFGLKQLLVDVAGLIVELLAFRDVAHHGLEPAAVPGRPGLNAGGHLDPHRGPVDATEPKQVGLHLPVFQELCEQLGARFFVHEPLRIERSDGVGGRVRRPAEHQAEMRVGRECFGAPGRQHADEHALMEGVEQPGVRFFERRSDGWVLRAPAHGQLGDGPPRLGLGVGVWFS